MRSTLLLVFLFIISPELNAQPLVRVPSASTLQRITMDYGGLQAGVDYYRIKLRNRTLFGEGSSYLFPFGKIWRTGANAGSFVSFSEDVMIQNKKLPKGKYVLVSWPGKTEWEISFYKDLKIGGQMQAYDASKDALRIKIAPVYSTNKIETMTFALSRIDENSGQLVFGLENTVLRIPFDFADGKNDSGEITLYQELGIDSILLTYTASLSDQWAKGKMQIPTTMEFAGETIPPGTYFFGLDTERDRFLLSTESGPSFKIPVAKTFAEPHFTYRTNGISINFSHIPEDNKSVYLKMEVGAYSYTVPIVCDYVPKVLKTIEEATVNPKFNQYFTVASFYYDQNMRLDQALSMIDIAIGQSPRYYWYHHLKSRILFNLGRYEEARDAANLTVIEAEKAMNQDYVKLGQEFLQTAEKKIADKNAVIISNPTPVNEKPATLQVASKSDTASYRNRVALVIGVRSYNGMSPLKNTLNDAQDISASLKKLGFTVVEVYDPKSKRQMQDGLRRYQAMLMKDRTAVGLIYYSGHGMQVDGVNYLIPTDIDLQVKADVEDQCLNMNYMMAVMAEARNPLNIFILDACRNNPFNSFERSGDRGLSVVTAPVGSYIVYATKPGSVASDGEGRNGLFTNYLLKHLSTPNLTIEQIFKRVAGDVIKASDNAQRPWIASDFTGEFYFLR